jgi:hypothetical protein
MSDPLEDELAALSPRAVSPELRRGVGERLFEVGSDGRPNFRRLRSGLVVLLLLAAAGVIAVVAPWKKDPPPPVPPVVEPTPPVEVESPDVPPSVLAYQRALARSPDDLSALLDKHATTPGPPPVAAFTRSNATLDALIGDD